MTEIIPIQGPHEVQKMSRVNTFRDLMRSLPLNEYGLPRFLYRPDMIPEDFFLRPREEQVDIQNAAAVDILYHEGFPAFETGAALWSQMPFEPDYAFTAFKYYLQQVDTIGVRQLEALLTDPQAKRVLDPSIDLKALGELHCYYCWGPRSRAHDLFQQAAWQKMRERRIMSTQDRHYLQTEQLLGKLETYFATIDEESGNPIWIEELTPKVALEFLKELYRIQRISLGLPANGEGGGGGTGSNGEQLTGAGVDMETAMRQIAKAGADPSVSRGNGQSRGLEALLADPETAALAQELIVRAGRLSGPTIVSPPPPPPPTPPTKPADDSDE